MKISYDFLSSLGEHKTTAFYEIKVNDKIRFIVPYNGNFYILFWLSISSDGSVCCGIRDLTSKKYASGTLENQDGKNVLDWSKVPELIDAKNPDQLRKMTFHKSGIIHGAEYGTVTFRNPLNKMISQEELFLALFREPIQYEEITGTTRKRDVLIPGVVPEGHTIFLQAFISPKDKFQDITINQGKSQHNVVLECNGIDEIGDIYIQLCFSFSNKAEYPPYSFMIWPALHTPKD